MSTQKHCPGCFQDKAWATTCPGCGYDESAARAAVFLPHGTLVGGQFRIGRVLGRRGGFGITYLGWDVHLQQRVAIKEYLPRGLAGRRAGESEIQLHAPEDAAAFDAGREQFLREARIVASLDHPNIVRVRSFFRANGTAYLVMDYYEGISLGDYLASIRSRLEPLQAVRLLRPVLDGLQYVHERGVVHRDLKPHNIYLASVGRPIVLDFGSATRAVGASVDSHSVVVSEGYAPLEQYQRHAAQGPWTDVYAIAATLYRMVSGQVPPVALDRIGQDPLIASGWPGLPDALRAVLEPTMAVRAADRVQSAREFRVALDACRGELEQLASLSADAAEQAAKQTTDAGAQTTAQRAADAADALEALRANTTAPAMSTLPRYRYWAALVAAACCGVLLLGLLLG